MRLTPLNIISASLLVISACLLINAESGGWRLLGTIPILVLVVLSFISDLVFRNLLPDIKRIWLFELVFIIFVAALIVLIRTFILN